MRPADGWIEDCPITLALWLQKLANAMEELMQPLSKTEILALCSMLNGIAALHQRRDPIFCERARALRAKLLPLSDPSVVEMRFDLTHEEAMTLDRAFNSFIEYLYLDSQNPGRFEVAQQAAALQARFNSFQVQRGW